MRDLEVEALGVLVIKFTNHPIPSNSEYMARLNLLELLELDKVYEQYLKNTFLLIVSRERREEGGREKK